MKFTVYCGSNPGGNVVYAEAATKLGHWLADEGHTLVYGGSASGLMGIVANAVLDHGGEAVGVFAEVLRGQEVRHNHLTDIVQVDTMTERKQIMYELGDVYLALPGGPGTMEEIVNIISWRRIGIHDKPAIFYNVNNFYTHLERHYDHMVTEGFINQNIRDTILFADTLDKIRTYLTSDL